MVHFQSSDLFGRNKKKLAPVKPGNFLHNSVIIIDKITCHTDFEKEWNPRHKSNDIIIKIIIFSSILVNRVRGENSIHIMNNYKEWISKSLTLLLCHLNTEIYKYNIHFSAAEKISIGIHC